MPTFLVALMVLVLLVLGLVAVLLLSRSLRREGEAVRRESAPASEPTSPEPNQEP